MQDTTRQGNKLVKRRPVGSRSPSRDRGPPAQHLSGDTPAVPALNDHGPKTPITGMGPSTSPTDKEKKSKWRLSNPFHSKDKERHDVVDTTKDSTYGSNEASSRSEISSSGIPSFSSTERRNSNPNRPVSSEQARAPLRPEPTTVQQAPTTNLIPPTPPNDGIIPSHPHENNSLHHNNVPRAHESSDTHLDQSNTPANHTLANQKSQENISKETHEDSKTGYMVTTTTTTTTVGFNR